MGLEERVKNRMMIFGDNEEVFEENKILRRKLEEEIV